MPGRAYHPVIEGLHPRIEEAIRLETQGFGADALDVLFEAFDDAHREGRFDDSDEALRTLCVDRLSIGLMIGALTVTNAARGRLSHRPFLVKRIRACLTVRCPERVDRLLSGLA